uniref:Uncharacterized protein n=1 Tax=Plectus sambesii TaxID=2011161 RepID=A0A914X704_9BILA
MYKRRSRQTAGRMNRVGPLVVGREQKRGETRSTEGKRTPDNGIHPTERNEKNNCSRRSASSTAEDQRGHTAAPTVRVRGSVERRSLRRRFLLPIEATALLPVGRVRIDRRSSAAHSPTPSRPSPLHVVVVARCRKNSFPPLREREFHQLATAIAPCKQPFRSTGRAAAPTITSSGASAAALSIARLDCDDDYWGKRVSSSEMPFGVGRALRKSVNSVAQSASRAAERNAAAQLPFPARPAEPGTDSRTAEQPGDRQTAPRRTPTGDESQPVGRTLYRGPQIFSVRAVYIPIFLTGASHRAPSVASCSHYRAARTTCHKRSLLISPLSLFLSHSLSFSFIVGRQRTTVRSPQSPIFERSTLDRQEEDRTKPTQS